MKKEGKIQKKIWQNSTTDMLPCLLGLFILLGIGGILTWFIYEMGYVGSGNDMWGHIYKANYLYENIKDGNWYPLYTKDWYNGVQPYRYWAPVPYYLYAGLEFLCGGSILPSYALFAFFSYVVGGFGFLLLGKRMNRILLGTAFGALWFFFPENFRVYFCEGNLPRMVTAIIIPYFIFFLYIVLEEQRYRALFGILFTTTLITLSHAMIGAMTGIATALFFCFYCYQNRVIRPAIRVIVTMLLSFLVAGIWLLPALSGGLVGMNADSSESVMASLMYELKDSLNPNHRISGVVDTFYYGIGVTVVAILGILLGKRKNRAGYYLLILILLMTTSSALPVLSKLPLSQLLWMMRFATLAYAFFILSFMQWKSLKKGFCVLFFFLLLLDSIPSMNVKRYYTQSADSIKNEIKEVKDSTVQRNAIMDLSAFGSYPSYALPEKTDISCTYGWAWQGAETADNIVKLNTSLEEEEYVYLFDRALELGNDTVLIRKNLVGKNGKTKKDVLNAASESGFWLLSEWDNAYIFKRNTPKQFGVKTTYDGMAIGNYASLLELYYPNFTTGDSDYLDDYTFEELKQYHALFLSGFSYHNRKKAEQLVEKLDAHGVRILVDVTHMPVNRLNNRMQFLDVYMQEITFETRYPELKYKGSVVKTLDFTEENREWNTGYLEGADDVIGSFLYSGKKLAFSGQKKSMRNTYFLGLNLTYHAMDTGDENAFSVVSDLLGYGKNVLPKRQVVPLKISYTNDGLTITSPEDAVNTTLAALDTFQSNREMKKHSHLLYVNHGVTKITFHYPYFVPGLLLSASGMLLFLLYFLGIQKKEKMHNDQENRIEEMQLQNNKSE